MGRKKHKDINTPVKKKEEERDISPFASIVLKEKKDEPKKEVKKPMPAKSGKKPHEIVQGYNPNASFADILYAFEHTGNPYVMPESKKKKISEKKTDFGAILDQWEGKTPSKKKEAAVEPKKASYKPTKSFADILSEFEGTGTPKNGKMSKVKPAFEEPEEVSFFRKEDEDYKRDPASSWSVLGGNENFVRKEKKKAEPKKEEKKEYRRASEPYKATKDFGAILSSFDGEKKAKEFPPLKEEKPAETIKTEKKPEFETPEEVTFFRKEDEDNKRAENASWSVLGRNDSFVRPEPKKEEPPKEVKEEPKKEPKKEEKRASKPYKGSKDFASILASYEEKKSQQDKGARIIREEESFEAPISNGNLFRSEDEDNKRAENASWSILGNNSSFKRPEKPVENNLPEIKSYERASKPYEPTKEFSDVLSDYENKKSAKPEEAAVPAEPVKTFEEILKEKGDSQKTKVNYSITELRRMLPQATLDLHGETAAESEAQIRAFLEECCVAGLRKISIITGKGLHSEGGVGILRDIAEKVLEESGMVSEKNNAPLRAGGSGALWIILKS